MQKRIVNRLILGAALIAGTLPTVAADVESTSAGSCVHPQTTAEMITCLERDYQAADARLNTVYKEQSGGLDEQGRRLLRNAQRAWIAFRDAECARARDSVRGGTLAPVLELGCALELTRKRTAHLDHGGESAVTAKAADNVFWREETLAGRFDCKETLNARVGLVPSRDPRQGEPTISARLRIGAATLDFPIGGKTRNALCGADVRLQIHETGDCPAIRLDDGMCDAIFIRWDAAKQGYAWTRN